MNKTYLNSGAGSGIGLAMAQKLAAGGDTCILLGRNLEKLQKVVAKLPGNHTAFQADVRSVSDLQAVANLLEGQALHGIIANAGVGGENYWGPEDRWSEIVDTNLTGTYQLVQTFLPNLALAKSTYTHIVITSSVLARLGVANYSAYCASKAGLLGLMRSWAVQFAPQHILVNAICPGWVNTNMAQEGLQGIADGLGMSKAEFYDIAMQSVPLKKMSEPEEIANLVSYLVNQESITGQSIDINCGSVMNS
ncbi:MAG: SDR family NAD(P)-dependent oxidoreductase [Sphingobacteriales bacterium]|nr:SDR family NAD(P)-dependent oxidoreductase [Sphingobacteriales bacterium]